MRLGKRFGRLAALTLFGGMLPFSAVVVATQPADDWRLASHRTEDGQSFFALSLLATDQLPAAVASQLQVAILVDTSASQTGLVRRESLEVLDSLLATLPEDARVALLACDVEAVDLSGGLQQLGSSELEHAVEALRRRVPLGTTDIGGALAAAANQISSEHGGSIIYVGDGIGRLRILSNEQRLAAVERLIERRISVLSLAIGPQVDVAFLAALANETGGQIIVRQSAEASPEEMGQALAIAAAVPVLWPSELELPEGLVKSLPSRCPPLRLDRDSVLIGQMLDESVSGSVRVVGSMAGQQYELQWDVTSEASSPDFAFLETIHDQAQTQRGRLLPIPGSDALRTVSRLLAASTEGLIRSARFALQAGDWRTAADLAQQIGRAHV